MTDNNVTTKETKIQYRIWYDEILENGSVVRNRFMDYSDREAANTAWANLKAKNDVTNLRPEKVEANPGCFIVTTVKFFNYYKEYEYLSSTRIKPGKHAVVQTDNGELKVVEVIRQEEKDYNKLSLPLSRYKTIYGVVEKVK